MKPKYEIGKHVNTIRGIGLIVNIFPREYETFNVIKYWVVFNNGITEPFIEEEIDLYDQNVIEE